jgi:carbamoyl-phosphate synthase large subunit
MRKIGLETPQSQLVNSQGRSGIRRAHRLSVHPAAELHLGGTGGGIAYNKEELVEILERGIALSPVHEGPD